MISNIQTLVQKRRENKRTYEQTTGMEIDSPTSSKTTKSFVPDKEIVDLENEESINQDIHVREGGLIQEKRSNQNETNNLLLHNKPFHNLCLKPIDLPTS